MDVINTLPDWAKIVVALLAAVVLVVLNADTGATVASLKAPERTDEVVWDAANRRIYVAGGEGYIGVFGQTDADHYTQLARLPSAPGAKTAVLAPSLNRLYVAASPGPTPTPYASPPPMVGSVVVVRDFDYRVRRAALEGESSAKSSALDEARRLLEDVREADRAAREQEAARVRLEAEAAALRRQLVSDISARLKQSVGVVVESVSIASEAMLETAQESKRVAGRSAQEIDDVVTVTAQSDTMIAGVAQATEELSRSSADIRDRVQRALERESYSVACAPPAIILSLTAI